MQISLKLKPEILGLVVYLLYLLILTMRPFKFAASPEIRYELLESFYRLDIKDFILNILLFIPFGFLLFSLAKNTNWKDYIKILVCGVLGASLSFIIETYQLFLPRDPQLSDIFMNGAGAFVGAILAKFYYNKVVRTLWYNWSRIQRSKSLLASIVILYSVTIFSLFIFPTQYFDFHNWDTSFTFQRNIGPRLRTALSRLKETEINLRTEDDFLTTEIQHVVTYGGGIKRLFVNGVKRSRIALFDNIKLLGFFGSNALSKIAFCFSFFFPLGFLSYVLFLNHFGETKKSSILSVFYSLGLLTVVEAFYITLFPRKGFDFSLMSIAALVGILTVFFCKVCAKSGFFRLDTGP